MEQATPWDEVGRAAWAARPDHVPDATGGHLWAGVPDPLSAQSLDAVDQPVFVADRGHRLVRLNRAATDRLGVEPGSVLGRPCYEVVHHASKPVQGCPCVALLADGRVHRERIVEPRLAAVWDVTCTPCFGADGDVSGAVHVISEVAGSNAQPSAALPSAETQVDEMARSVCALVELRDPYTARHQRRVARLAEAMAGRLSLGATTTRGLRLAALLHDIAKIGVPAEVLAKPGRLSEAETAIVRGHAEAAYRLLATVPFRGPVAEVVYQHHERLDGSGYPRGLHADDILPEARILAVADVAEAMLSQRPHRAALGLQAVTTELRRGAGSQYDSAAVEACLDVLQDGLDLQD